MRSPKKVERVGDKLHLTLEMNQFESGENKEKVVGTGQTEIDICDVVFRSVGYRGKMIFEELPFDEQTGIIPNVGGKIEDGRFRIWCPRNYYFCNDSNKSLHIVLGIYCCGWAGQGPRGVILSTMQHSFDVAKMIVHDMENVPHSDKHGIETIKEQLKHKRLTHYSDFAKIAEFETKHNRKVTSIEEMFAIINGKLW